MKESFSRYIAVLMGLFLIAQSAFGEDIVSGNVPHTSGNYILKTADAIFTIADSAGDILLIKRDTMCNIIWTKTVGLPVYEEFANCMDQTPEGGFILYGTSNRNSVVQEAWLVKLDSLGNELWNRTFFNFPIDGSSGHYCKVFDGNRYFLNHFRPQYMAPAHNYAMMVDSTGSGLWSTLVEDSVHSSTPQNYLTLPDGFLLAYSHSWTGYLYQITKLDTNGNILFSNRYSSSLNLYPTLIHFINSIDDSTYLFGGSSQDALTNNSLFLYGKLDNLGNISWLKTLDLGSTIGKSILAAQCLLDSTCLLLGEIYLVGSMLIKIDQVGDTLWIKYFNEGFNFRDIKKISEERYCVIGEYTDTINGEVSTIYLELDKHGNASNCLFVSLDEMKFDPTDRIDIFPIPGISKFHVRIDVPHNGQYEWQLSDYGGKILKSGTIDLDKDVIQEFEISDFNQSGILFFSIQFEDYKFVRKLIMIDY